MPGNIKMTRITAFLIHLGISAVIFFILLYFIIFHWYPFPLFSSDGGWQGIQIIAGIDLVLGPLLTLIVFKPGKPSLKMDLSIIACIQLTALIWGSWITYKESPVAIVYSANYFKPVTNYQVAEAGTSLTKIRELDGNKLPIIYLQLPDDATEAKKIRLESVRKTTPLYLFGNLYARFSDKNIGQIENHSIDLAHILEKETGLNSKTKNKIKSYLDMKNNNNLYLNLWGRHKKQVAVFDKEQYIIIDIIDVDRLGY